MVSNPTGGKKGALLHSAMRSIIKTILFGLLIGTAIMAIVYSWAMIGYSPAMNLLLDMTLPPFNIAAAFMEPVPADDLERGGQRIDLLLMLAWVQIGAISAVAVAAARAALVRR